MGLLEAKIAVITGSSRGIGLAIARAFANEGAAVVLASRTNSAVVQAVDALKQEGAEATGIACDVSDAEQVKALADHAIQTFGHFDVWMNNAALSAPYGPTVEIPVDQFVQVTETNILGVYYGSSIAMHHFLKRERGKLINVLGDGDRSPRPFQNAYASSKAWIRNFSLALARESRQSGVDVFTFNPGLVATDLLKRGQVIAGYESRLSALGTVLRIWGNPAEIPARKAVWLASKATDGRSGLQVRVLNPTSMLAGLLREGARRITGQTVPPVEIQTTIVPSALDKVT